MPHHVFVYQLRILLGVSQHVRTRSYDTHIASQDIPELRQFINIGLAHQVSEGKLSRVVLCSLYLVSILVYVHRAELVAVEVMSFQTGASLTEEDRSRALYLYNQSNKRKKDSRWN